MGYDAYVSCNCYKEGKATEFPYKEYLEIDEEGVLLSDTASDDIYSEFNKWKKTACSHPNMELVDERLANAWGMAEFRLLIEKMGGKSTLPILTEHLPVCNGGTLPVEYAVQALAEIENICSVEDKEAHLVLKDMDGNLIASTNDLVNFSVFGWTGRGRFQYGLYNKMFTIIEKSKSDILRREKTEIVFNSDHFYQYRLSENEYKFVDINSKATFICSMGLGSDKNIETLECRVTEESYYISDNYKYILDTLKRLLLASIETGNPIVWY
ncbi:MAG: hypothetical protein E6767_11385 [Dysgonomonas sp.]|nr:hypothetical protein [Dysgonomonas sp.]